MNSENHVNRRTPNPAVPLFLARTGRPGGIRTPDPRFRKPWPHRSPCSEQRICSRIRYLSFGSEPPVRAPVCTKLCTTSRNPRSKLHADPSTAATTQHLQAAIAATGNHSTRSRAPGESKARHRLQSPALRSLRTPLAPASQTPASLHSTQWPFPVGNHRPPSLWFTLRPGPPDTDLARHSRSQAERPHSSLRQPNSTTRLLPSPQGRRSIPANPSGFSARLRRHDFLRNR